MKQHDLSIKLDPVTIRSMLFKRRFILDSMHELLWKRIFPLRQTNHDSRLSDYESVYDDLEHERDIYESILSNIPKEKLLSAAYK